MKGNIKYHQTLRLVMSSLINRTSHELRLTLQRPRRQDVLVHVVEVIREEEVLRGRRSQAEEGRVQVEGGSQRSQTRVIDHTETR